MIIQSHFDPMKKIYLKNDVYSIVDDEDFPLVNTFRWFLDESKGKKYASRIKTDNGIRKKIRLHRFIMNPVGGMEIDHKDGDGLNCTKSNMRVCTRGENCRNRKKTLSIKTSRYKGVYWHKSNRKWTAQITSNGKQIFLGYFLDDKDAASAYNSASKVMHKEYSNING